MYNKGSRDNMWNADVLSPISVDLLLMLMRHASASFEKSDCKYISPTCFESMPSSITGSQVEVTCWHESGLGAVAT